MKKLAWALASLAVIAGGVYAYRALAPAPCTEPITYRIGSVDPRFGVSTTTFESDIAQAAGIWDAALGKTLYAYDPNGVVTVSLVYDSRQAITQQEQTLNSSINQNTQTADSIKAQYSALKAQYSAAQAQYLSDLAAYNQEESSYNAEVNRYNSEGGAPPQEYAALNQEKNNLDSEQDSLEAEREQVNTLADNVNAFGDKYNLLVTHINSDVSAINNDGLAGTQFEEGVYISDASGRRINIYQFESQGDLIHVLAHELGHAIGLWHNSNPDSIMNPVNVKGSLIPTKDDMAELDSVCNITTGE